MDIHAILKQYWGFAGFRPLQEDIIRSVLAGKPAVAILPTGGGKSVCYQVPAMAMPGICIVISPLIALMKDQVQNLNNKGIKAVAIYSGMSANEIDLMLDNCIYGSIKFLYVSPERLSTELFQVRVQKMQVNLLAIDEAHCISQWGHDFRPAYRKIADVLPLIPGVPVLALTATATPQVKEDIQQQLQIKDAAVFQASFARKNLAYVVRHTEDKYGKMIEAVKKIKGSAIVYVRNRRKTREVAETLTREGIKADFYHAGLTMALRSQRQEDWINNKTQVIVCTNAFGMGIDKPDVRLVVHIDMPDNIESYYQEAGRAGRDGRKAFALLLYNDGTVRDAQNRLANQFPNLDEVMGIYSALGNFLKLAVGSGEGESFQLDLSKFTITFNLSPAKVLRAFKVLERFDLLAVSDAVFNPSKVRIMCSNEDLYKFQIANRKFDPFIKLLLRSYPGVFDTYVIIKEQELARAANVELSQVQGMLAYLVKAQMLDYVPTSNQPQVTYITARQADIKKLIDHAYIRARAEQYERQMTAMTGYMENLQQCRTNYLQAYFGEKPVHRCDICDVCMEQLSGQTHSERQQTIIQELKVIMQHGEHDVKELMHKVKGYQREEVLQVLRYLLDEGWIKESDPGLFYWNT